MYRCTALLKPLFLESPLVHLNCCAPVARPSRRMIAPALRAFSHQRSSTGSNPLPTINIFGYAGCISRWLWNMHLMQRNSGDTTFVKISAALPLLVMRLAAGDGVCQEVERPVCHEFEKVCFERGRAFDAVVPKCLLYTFAGMGSFERLDVCAGQDPTTSYDERHGPANATYATNGTPYPEPAPPLRQPVPPLLQNAGRSGGVQGLSWYTSGMKEDCDGDVALEFLEEPSHAPSAPHATAELRSTQHPIMKACNIL